MVDKNSVINSLRGVLDPEIGISIVDLNMVRDVSIEGSHVKVTIALTVAHCPLAKTLQTDVEKALKKSNEVKSVSVETTAMSKTELNELRTRLQNKAVQIVTSILAVQLRRLGYEVGILDADLTGPSIAKVFGLKERPSKSSTGRITPVLTRTGIKVMSINLVLDDPEMPVIWRGPIVNSVIRQLYWDVDWGSLHYLLVDLPPGTSDAPLTVLQSLPLDGVIVVSSPQELASLIVTKAVNMAKKMNAQLLGLVENMSYLTCPHCGEAINVFGEPHGEKLAEQLGVPFLGSAPIDPVIARLSDHGQIEDYSAPVFQTIADELRNRTSQHAQQLMQGLPIAWSIQP